tara:strand:+ start:1217 stop:1477 length:261 start_codon:yes stop_codon:yes gene_type:complete
MNTEIYKTININTDQSAILMTLIDQFIKKERESINFFTNKLNSSDTTKDVRDYTGVIKISKGRISQLANLQDDIINSELTTKHQLR